MKTTSCRKMKIATKAALWAVTIVICGLGAFVYSSRVVGSMLAGVDSHLPVDDVPDAELLLHTSIQKLESLDKLSASVEFEGTYFGDKYFGRGRYEEASASSPFGGLGRRNPFEKTRFRLSATLSGVSGEELRQSDDSNNFVEIVCDCDTRLWWRYSSIEDVKSLSRIDIEELWENIQQLDDSELASLAENGVASLTCGLNGMPGLGGLAGSLKRIDAFYTFDDKIEPVQVQNGEKLYKVTGVVKEKFWDLAKSNMKVDSFMPYMIENLPTNVDLYFGVDWAFPYIIEYYSVQGDRGEIRNTVLNVRYTPNNETIRAEDFKFDQPENNYDHVEGEYLESLVPNLRR